MAIFYDLELPDLCSRPCPHFDPLHERLDIPHVGSNICKKCLFNHGYTEEYVLCSRG